MIRESENMKNRLVLLTVILLSFSSCSCDDPEEESLIASMDHSWALAMEYP